VTGIILLQACKLCLPSLKIAYNIFVFPYDFFNDPSIVFLKYGTNEPSQFVLFMKQENVGVSMKYDHSCKAQKDCI